MASEKPQQQQDSRQSAEQGEPKRPAGTRPSSTESGIGSSQGQDTENRRGERPSAGTPDVERGGGSQDVERSGGTRGESLTHDPVGAYSERP